MEAMRQSWTDERLDDFRSDVNRPFDWMDGRFDRIDHELNRINDRLDSLSKAMVFGSLTLSGSMLTGLVAIAFAS